MALLYLFDDASRVMTVISFATFAAILGWTYVLRREKDFAQAACLPFADNAADDTGDDLEEDYV